MKIPKNHSKIVVGIPARFASTRFPGKPLADLAGKPMIVHVIEKAMQANIGQVFVATDDERIAAVARAVGSDVFMSQAPHNSGSERLAEAVQAMDCDIVVNVQGDEPLIEPLAIQSVVRPFMVDSSLEMATLAHPLLRSEDLYDPNVVKVVCNAKGHAMYFSRSALPFPRQAQAAPALQHVGLYAYTKDFLCNYSNLQECPSGEAEQLEQLRVLHHGHSIAVSIGDFHCLGIDTSEDLERAKKILCQS
ncbi:MAG: 3-deoxy-manno-octulosonate cytidylyltransferase [Mariprofundaceae bacterium]|nr:3-deoxy-manno-octulosonate cytidylyltransferase [Mariprofundaceae bacterium]